MAVRGSAAQRVCTRGFQHVTARDPVLLNLYKKSVVIIEIVTVLVTVTFFACEVSADSFTRTLGDVSWGLKHFYGSVLRFL
jgi:hypothetical protein